MKYQVELVWNREFQFVRCGEPFDDLKQAIAYAKAMENSGDGARVKKTQIVDAATGDVVWVYGKAVKENSHVQNRR